MSAVRYLWRHQIIGGENENGGKYSMLVFANFEGHSFGVDKKNILFLLVIILPWITDFVIE